MANREKRLRKGIESIEEQILIHKEKMKIAIEKGNIDLEGYYKKEIDNLDEAKNRKKRQINN